MMPTQNTSYNPAGRVLTAVRMDIRLTILENHNLAGSGTHFIHAGPAVMAFRLAESPDSHNPLGGSFPRCSEDPGK